MKCSMVLQKALASFEWWTEKREKKNMEKNKTCKLQSNDEAYYHIDSLNFCKHNSRHKFNWTHQINAIPSLYLFYSLSFDLILSYFTLRFTLCILHTNICVRISWGNDVKWMRFSVAKVKGNNRFLWSQLSLPFNFKVENRKIEMTPEKR